MGLAGAAVSLIALLLGGCQSVSVRYDDRARAHGIASSEVEGAGFRHRMYGRLPEGASHVRVYIEGDGTPWLRGRAIAADPTPRKPFALELLARDGGAALLLGRPCYHGFAADGACDASLWTDARYGEAVVASLAVALGSVLRGCEGARVTLVGYSGGGAIAVLLAEHVPAVERVITIAANLDVSAWVVEHGYLPLGASLDPVRRESARGVDEIHLVGTRDENVPPAIAQSYAARFPHARIEPLPFDHTCCWIEAWPELLARFDRD